MQIVDGPEFHVEQISDLAVAVRVIADAVKLKISITQSGRRGLATKLFALRELDSIGRALHRVIANLARVFDRIDKVRRDGRLTAGELYRHLPARLNRNRVVQDLLHILHAQLMHETDLVRIHKAWI